MKLIIDSNRQETNYRKKIDYVCLPVISVAGLNDEGLRPGEESVIIGLNYEKENLVEVEP